MANIDDFKAKLTGGGARSNLFKVTCNFPGVAGGDSELASFMIKGAQFPSSVVAPIPVLWRGRQYQEKGDRTIEPLNLTVINDTNMEIRNAFEAWSNAINQMRENKSDFSGGELETDITIEQLDRAENVTKTYIFRGCWPSNISQIDLSSDSENTIQEFTVELQVLYWEVAGLTS